MTSKNTRSSFNNSFTTLRNKMYRNAFIYFNYKDDNFYRSYHGYDHLVKYGRINVYSPHHKNNSMTIKNALLLSNVSQDLINEIFKTLESDKKYWVKNLVNFKEEYPELFI